ncbi:hypothetical protein OSB04_016671 [Centaurea solstitialis]|uniref:Putative plant transposon protein domain-containing protein n=1 Tax=Centaurea solstitialis TaxID=347529 RepID=A0AA38TCG3_9ASTR|nr:hypothetical protein OSB04_016671 [Centaurea solstitialis]
MASTRERHHSGDAASASTLRRSVRIAGVRPSSTGPAPSEDHSYTRAITGLTADQNTGLLSDILSPLSPVNATSIVISTIPISVGIENRMQLQIPEIFVQTTNLTNTAILTTTSPIVTTSWDNEFVLFGDDGQRPSTEVLVQGINIGGLQNLGGVPISGPKNPHSGDTEGMASTGANLGPVVSQTTICRPKQGRKVHIEKGKHLREFYAKVGSSPNNILEVRGKPIDCTSAALNTALGLSLPLICSYSQMTHGFVEVTDDQILAVLALSGHGWTIRNNRRFLYTDELNLEAALWFQFMRHNVDLTIHDNKISCDGCLLLYCILRELPIDVGAIARDAILDASKRLGSRLVFPSLLTRMFANAGVWVEILAQSLVEMNERLPEILDVQRQILSNQQQLTTRVAELETRTERFWVKYEIRLVFVIVRMLASRAPATAMQTSEPVTTVAPHGGFVRLHESHNSTAFSFSSKYDFLVRDMRRNESESTKGADTLWESIFDHPSLYFTADLLEPFEELEREFRKRNKKKSKADKVRPRALIFEMGDEAPMWTARRVAPTVPTNPITKPGLNKEIPGKLLHMIKDLTFDGKNDSNPIVHMENVKPMLMMTGEPSKKKWTDIYTKKYVETESESEPDYATDYDSEGFTVSFEHLRLKVPEASSDDDEEEDGKQGGYAEFVISKKQDKGKEKEKDKAPEDELIYIAPIKHDPGSYNLPISCHRFKGLALVDSGAALNMMPVGYCRKMGVKKIIPTDY